MEDAAGSARCACGRSWKVAPRPDGTLAARARCAAGDGGCGRSVRVRRAASIPAPAAAWDPPSAPRPLGRCAEPCPRCGALEVRADERGITRVCLACHRRVTPPGVLAPYERGSEVTRAAKSQRERDRDALDLAGRKGVMLGELRRLAADDRLDDASVMKAEWFAEQVRAATAGARLDDLAELFAAERIRPREWFQRPASITAGHADEDDEDQDDDEDEDEDEEGAVLATPASIAEQQHRAQPGRMTWAEAIAASGLQVAAELDGCQITERGWQCSGGAVHNIGGTWACGLHYESLAAVISSHYRQQRTA